MLCMIEEPARGQLPDPRPHPGPAPPPGAVAAPRPEPLDRLHDLVDPAPLGGPGPQHRRTPLAGAPVGQTQHGLQFRRRPVRSGVVGLVDHEHVGDLHHPRLQGLHAVAAPGHRHHQRDVGGPRHLDFGLPHPHRLDDDDVEPRRVEHEGGVAGGPRQPPELAAAGHAPHEHAGVAGVRLHPDPVAEHRAAAERAAGIDGQHADRPAAGPQDPGEAVDQGALPDPGSARHADEVRAPGAGMDRPHQRRRRLALVLDARNGPGDRPAVALEHPDREPARVGRHASASRYCLAMIRRWISLVPSPMVVSFTSRKNFSAG